MLRSGPESYLRRLKGAAIGWVPLSMWERALRLRPIRAMRGTLAASSPVDRLAEGGIRFERLRFRFVAPPRAWIKARQAGIEARICRLVMDRCRPGHVGIDVGASSGFISLVMALSVGPAGRVISFEPDADYHQILKRNVEINGLGEVCRPHAAFVGRDDLDGSHVCLDAVVRRQNLTRVDVVKIDVDGGDVEVLRGAGELLLRWRPLVVVEMTREQDAIYRFLKEDIGYTTLVGMEGETVAPGTWPANLIAGDGAIVIPRRGQLR